MKIEMDADANRVARVGASRNENYDVLALMSWALFREYNSWEEEGVITDALDNVLEWMKANPGQINGD